MIYCNNCGHQNADDARVCMNCGQAFTGQGSSTPFSAPPPPTQQQQQQQQQGQTPWGTPADYGAPMQQRPGGGLFAVGERREPVTVILLTIVTCGIYAIWWYYTMATEIKNSLGREELNPGMDLLLMFVTCGIWGIIAFYYKYPKLMVEMQQRVGMPVNDISTMTLIFAFVFSPVSIFMIQDQLNTIWNAAAGHRPA